VQEDRTAGLRRRCGHRRGVPRQLVFVPLAPTLQVVVCLEVNDHPRTILFKREVDDTLDYDTGRRLHRDRYLAPQAPARRGRERTLEERVPCVSTLSETLA